MVYQKNATLKIIVTVSLLVNDDGSCFGIFGLNSKINLFRNVIISMMVKISGGSK